MAPFEKVMAWFVPEDDRYRRTRFLFLRGLGFIYFIAFVSLAGQVLPLIGHDGLLPADDYLVRLRARAADVFLPTIFWWNCSDHVLYYGAWVGVAVSALVMLGLSNAIVMAFLWFLYMSYVHVGQIFYGYGWETMTLEAGFLAIFLCPALSFRSSLQYSTTPVIFLWLRWMLFRVMLGAGLIKIRGDECWRDLTCLVYHYETQPIPNALSWYLHQAPMWFHKAGCLFNHFVELVVPLFYFAPPRLRRWAGGLTIVFQLILIFSGNLSWLNWLTLVIAISCLDDTCFPKWGRGDRIAAGLKPGRLHVPVLIVLSIGLAYLSKNPLLNMISPSQLMNASFDPFHLMNTYGAFGSVGKVRNEIILEGSYDGETWAAYEFRAKPGDPQRRPPVIAPYQSRIDWQIWFAAMQDPNMNPWLIHMIYKLLRGDEQTASLLRLNPFKTGPPKFIRCELYEYHFTADRRDGAWWGRVRVGAWLPPMTADDPPLRRYIEANGWEN